MIGDIKNFVSVSVDLATAGQPSVEQLREVAAEGFDVVVNLGLLDPRYCLDDEAGVTQSLGMTYHHIPVDFNAPRFEDLQKFFEVMEASRSEKVFVHCAANYRVSSFVGLFGEAKLGWSRDRADAHMRRVWEPNATWSTFIDGARRRLLPEIRTATRVDADAIAAAHFDSIHSVGPSYYAGDLVERWAAGVAPALYLQAMDEGEVFFVATGERDGTPCVLGFSSHRVDEGHDGVSVYVRGSETRRGLGTRLLQIAEGHAVERAATAIDIDASFAGVDFYLANGFEETGRGEIALRSGLPMPVVFMRKRLTP
jgi:protein tyrosine phosphatase (PTP) superfamily phosphohydrolase (DUF442 family)